VGTRKAAIRRVENTNWSCPLVDGHSGSRAADAARATPGSRFSRDDSSWGPISCTAYDTAGTCCDVRRARECRDAMTRTGFSCRARAGGTGRALGFTNGVSSRWSSQRQAPWKIDQDPHRMPSARRDGDRGGRGSQGSSLGDDRPPVVEGLISAAMFVAEVQLSLWSAPLQL